MKRILILPFVTAVIVAHAQFSVPRVIHQHTSPRQSAIEVGDIDSDGDQDILGVSGYHGDVDWWENDGAGHFVGKHHIDAIGVWSNDARLADLDADGDLDVIVTGHTTVGLAWAEQLGNGSFASLVQLVPGGPGFTFDGFVDLNGNGRTDVLVRHSFMSTVTIRWYEFDDAGVFVEHGPVETGLQTPTRVRATDVDQDGMLDLLVSIAGIPSLHKLLGDGAGNFSLGEAVWASGNHPSLMEMLDTDDDGDEDLVGRFSFDGAGYGTAENVNGSFLDPVEFDSVPQPSNAGVFPADLDGDGDPDILGMAAGLVFWSRNDGGAFAPIIRISDIPLSPDELCAADLDGDGMKDITLSSHSEGLLCWFKNLGAGQFDQFRLIGRGFSIPYDFSLAELDGHPGMDLLVTSGQDSRIGVFPWVPGQMYPLHHLVDSAARGVSMSVAIDDDGDADADILSILYSDSAIVRYENNGQGFAPGVPIVNGMPFASRLRTADLDDDGSPDLIAAGQGLDMVVVLGGAGDGTYAPPSVLPGSQDATDVRIADLNEDGTPDIIVSQGPPSHRIVWYANDGQGGFDEPQILTEDTFYPLVILLADLDGDQVVDLVGHDQQSHLAVFFGQGNGVFGQPTIVSAPDEQPNRTSLADFDLDGDMDIIASFEQAGIIWFRNDGNGGFPQQHTLLDSQQLQYLSGPLDIDSDGDQDIMIWSWDYGTLGYLENMVIGGFTVQGEVFADLNEDGMRDPDEPGVPQAHISCDPPATAPLTNPDGSYTFYLPEGDYTVSVQNVPEYWELTTDPAQYDLSLANGSPAFEQIDFGLAPTIDTTIIALSVSPGQVPCGDTTIHQLSITNLGTTRPSLVIAYELDSLYQFLGSVPPVDSLVGHVAYWHLDDLTWQLPTNISCELISPLWAEVQADSTSGNTLSAFVQGGADISSTFFSWTMECAYDPNDKHVDPQGYGDVGAIPMSTAELTYRIRFQNTGTATAQSIMIRDRISEHLDPSTLYVIGWSHEPSAMMIENDGELSVSFDNIQLPDSTADFLGSMGYITYRIAVRTGAEHATQILNEAEIYFDNEAAIVTNTTTSTLVDCDLWSPSISEPFTGMLRATPGDSYQWFLGGVPLPGADQQDLAVPGIGFFTVEVTSMFGCVATSEPYQVISTGSVAATGLAISIFPVPFSNTARLVMDRPLSSKHMIDLMDPAGRVVRSWKGNGRNELLIDRGGVTSGIYLVRVSNGVVQVAACRVVID